MKLFHINIDLEYEDESQQWFDVILSKHLEEARLRALSLVAQGFVADTGCIETSTLDARKLRFKGSHLSADRFIFGILNETKAAFDDIVRHRCNNPR